MPQRPCQIVRARSCAWCNLIGRSGFVSLDRQYLFGLAVGRNLSTKTQKLRPPWFCQLGECYTFSAWSPGTGKSKGIPIFGDRSGVQDDNPTERASTISACKYLSVVFDAKIDVCIPFCCCQRGLPSGQITHNWTFVCLMPVEH